MQGWYLVEATVRGMESWPLKGAVKFHLDQSFAQQIRMRKAANNVASIAVLAWGAFTIGVRCDKGITKLELDLAELAEMPADFREVVTDPASEPSLRWQDLRCKPS